MSDTKMYNLKITENQAYALSRACEILARLGIGQFRDALEEIPREKMVPEGWHEDMHEIGRILSRHTKRCVDGWKSSLSIHSEDVSETSKIAWDLYQVVRHQLAWDKAIKNGAVKSMSSQRDWSRMMGVMYDEPIVTSLEPLAEISKAVAEK